MSHAAGAAGQAAEAVVPVARARNEHERWRRRKKKSNTDVCLVAVQAQYLYGRVCDARAKSEGVNHMHSNAKVDVRGMRTMLEHHAQGIARSKASCDADSRSPPQQPSVTDCAARAAYDVGFGFVAAT